MFRKDLQRRLEQIFGIEKTTFLAPSDEFEQDTMFIDVISSSPRLSNASGGRETAKVSGTITVFSQDNRLPYGFFNKAIERADPELTNPLFFFDIDTDIGSSPARTQNIHERRVSFVFLYDAQYDPNRGELTSLEITDIELED